MSDGHVRRVTLLTDFGTRDGYAGAMRGVIAAIAPDAIVEDAGHDIPAGDILAGALAIERYWHLYPPGTVHVVVVDPGVGTERRGIVAHVDGRIVVAPDNGVLTMILEAASDATVHEIQDASLMRSPVSRTFHGRDVFAPVAAHLAAGVSPDAVGPLVDDPVRLDLPRVRLEGHALIGSVLIEDRFGNLITNVPATAVPQGGWVVVRDMPPIPICATYADVEVGLLLAVVGSSDRLEISVRDGNAAERLHLRRGAEVRVEPD